MFSMGIFDIYVSDTYSPTPTPPKRQSKNIENGEPNILKDNRHQLSAHQNPVQLCIHKTFSFLLHTFSDKKETHKKDITLNVTAAAYEATSISRVSRAEIQGAENNFVHSASSPHKRFVVPRDSWNFQQHILMHVAHKGIVLDKLFSKSFHHPIIHKKENNPIDMPHKHLFLLRVSYTVTLFMRISSLNTMGNANQLNTIRTKNKENF